MTAAHPNSPEGKDGKPQETESWPDKRAIKAKHGEPHHDDSISDATRVLRFRSQFHRSIHDKIEKGLVETFLWIANENQIACAQGLGCKPMEGASGQSDPYWRTPGERATAAALTVHKALSACSRIDKLYLQTVLTDDVVSGGKMGLAALGEQLADYKGRDFRTGFALSKIESALTSVADWRQRM